MLEYKEVIRIIDEMIEETRLFPELEAEDVLRCLKKELMRI